MKLLKRYVSPALKFCGVLLGIAAGLHFLGGDILAADAPPQPEWRATYDVVMRWVNFLILAAVLVKYTRTPLRRFLAQRKDELRAELDDLELQKREIMAQVEQTGRIARAHESRLANLRERLISDGEKKKHVIIRDARRQKDLLLEKTAYWIDNRIRQARDDLKAELADAVIDSVLQEIPAKITASDHRRFVDNFLFRGHLT